MSSDFHGAKAAIFIDQHVLVYQRDDLREIPFPNLWDFPGGGRENNETPFETLQRETHEEFGLTIKPDEVLWQQSFASLLDPDLIGWMFVVHLKRAAAAQIEFGDEGQHWRLVTLSQLWRLDFVPGLRDRLSAFYDQKK